MKEVGVVEIASLADKNNFYQFIHTYLCFFAPFKLNTFIKFRLAIASKPPLTNLPLLLKPST